MENNNFKPRNTVGGKGNPVTDPFAEEALDWFVRLQANPGDRKTAQLFREWTGGDARRAAAFEKVFALWGAPEFLRATANVAQATGFSANRKKRSSSGTFGKRAAGLATAILVICGGQPTSSSC